MDGLQEEEFYQRKHMYDRMNTPDGYERMKTPTRSARSYGKGTLNRSNSRKSILKSNTNKNIDGASHSPIRPHHESNSGFKGQVSFADLNMRNHNNPGMQSQQNDYRPSNFTNQQTTTVHPRN